jgi:hypothetical protein
VREDETVDMVGSRYVDKLERRNGTWAIIDRICVLEWAGELVKGSKIPPMDLFILGRWYKEDVSYDRPLTKRRPARNLYTSAES